MPDDELAPGLCVLCGRETFCVAATGEAQCPLCAVALADDGSVMS